MKILMVNVPYAGHTNPTLVLAKELVRRGHQVKYINAEEFREKIESTGAIFIPYRNYPTKISEQKKKRLCFRAAFDTAMLLEDKFDLLIYEMFFYPAIEIARRKGIPCVRQFSQPAWSSDTLKNASKLFRLSCKLIDVQVMGKKNARYMGLKNRTLVDAVIYDEPDLNLVYVSEKFQKEREKFGRKYVFVVPIAEHTSKDDSIPYEEMKHPIVYISLGSIISNRGFCKECIRAFGNKELSVILNTGKINPQILGNIPSNIYAYSFVPQIQVLQHADVFLTHCGMNSVNEAICAGVPMVAMPFLNDQLENANRVEQLGIAKRVRSFPTREKKLYDAVYQVLHNKEMRRNIKEMQKEMKGRMDWDDIVNQIEAVTVK